MEFENRKLTPEQKKIIEEYAQLKLDIDISTLALATFFAKHPIILLFGLGIAMVVMWSFGFLFGITARQ